MWWPNSLKSARTVATWLSRRLGTECPVFWVNVFLGSDLRGCSSTLLIKNPVEIAVKE